MASPLLAYANSRIRVDYSSDVTQETGGRFIVDNTSYYLIQCYLKRMQYSGVTSGSRKVPLPSELYGEMLPGASGDEFYYRGYVLQSAVIAADFDWKDGDTSGLTFTEIKENQSYLVPQKEVDLFFGDTEMRATIQRSSGVFGGEGIDKIIYPSIGVQIQLTAVEILG